MQPLVVAVPTKRDIRAKDFDAAEKGGRTERLGEVDESAFLETAIGDGVEVLVEGLCARRAWWWRLFRPRSS